ncbi:MAG: amidohydrolase family protein [Myxococcales bacterium]|nr:amidohydrolase family protein [Myxococcales bacterium]
MRPLALLLAAAAAASLACAGAREGATDEPAAPICPVPERAIAPASSGPAAGLPPAIAGPRALLLRGARVIDGGGGPPRPGLDILVDETGLIVKVAAGIAAPADAEVIDVGGRTVLPGLIDAHTHLLSEPASSFPALVTRGAREGEADRALRGAANAWATLQAGFTTVRNVGGTLADRSLRDAIDAGRLPGPRMLVANHSIGITGGHCDHTNGLHPEKIPAEPDFTRGIADGPDGVRKAVRYQIKQGADVIKICATGGVLSQGDGVGAPQLSAEEMRAIVDEAGRAERKVAAHAHGTQGIRDAVLAGVHSVEHGSILDPPTVALMKKRGVFLVPTTYVGRYVEGAAEAGRLSPDSAAKAQAIAPRMRESFRLAYKSGVKIANGSDAGVFPHGDNALELAEMVELGMSPADAIVAATASAAELLGLADVGRIAEGKVGDLIVVDGDPLADIRALQAPALVVKGGRVYVRRF